MKKIIFRLLANAVLLYAATFFVPALRLDGPPAFLLAGFVLGLVNLLVRPVLLFLTLPLNLLTLGLFTLVVNTWMLMLTDSLVDSMTVGGFLPALLTAVLLAAGNLLLTPFKPK
ncbi:MAG TPA: phage holin family protein [Selenomonadales bacterium]|nr:phage holin family protein [Selenomonadales bacterium]